MQAVWSPLRSRVSRRAALVACLVAVGIGLAAGWTTPPLAQEAAAPSVAAKGPAGAQDFGALFDAVVATTAKEFWDKDKLAAVGWEKRAAEVRPNVVEAATLTDAASRINALLAELATSHTGLLTPDDVDYYILMAVFGGASMPQAEFDERFWGAGVTFAGTGFFSVRLDGRDFVDAVLEGSPAARAGLQVGDEIVSVDGAPYHPIRSFQGKVGRQAGVAIRRQKEGPVEIVRVQVMAIAPLHAFREATRASARVIERDGRRIGYVHVWASVGEESSDALRDAIAGLGVNERPAAAKNGKAEAAEGKPGWLDGLIIDMRGKIGGTGSNAARYLNVIDPRGPLMGPRERNKASRAMTAVRGKTAVLIDHHTRSTGELFVHAYKRERQGPLIGTRTAGAVSAARAFSMPGGSLLYLAVSGLEIDGEVLEGPGVSPDIEVARPIPYSAGADPVLERAVETLIAKARARDAAAPNRKPPGD